MAFQGYGTELPDLDLIPAYKDLITKRESELKTFKDTLKFLEEQKRKQLETWKCLHVSKEDLKTLLVTREVLALDAGSEHFREMILHRFGLFKIKDSRDRVIDQQLGEIVATNLVEVPYNIIDSKETRVVAHVRFADTDEGYFKLCDISDDLPTDDQIKAWQEECLLKKTQVLSKQDAKWKVRQLIRGVNELTPEDEIGGPIPEMFGKGSIGRQKMDVRNSIALARTFKKPLVLNDSLKKSRALDLESKKRESNRERLNAAVSKAEILKASRKQEENLELIKELATKKRAVLDDMAKDQKLQSSGKKHASAKGVLGSVRTDLLYNDIYPTPEKKSKLDD